MDSGLSSTVGQPSAVADAPPEAATPPQTAGLAKCPSGHVYVTIVMSGRAVVQDQLTQLLPRATFGDVCVATLRSAEDAPTAVAGMQAFMVLHGAGGGDRALEVQIQNLNSNAADTLRAFPTVHQLRYDVEPVTASSGPGRGGLVAVRVVRRPRLPRIARFMIGLAKFVIAVEAAMLLRGGLRAVARQARRGLRGGRSGSEDGDPFGSDVGPETEAALDTVVEYVSGRAGLEQLQRFDPRVVRQALESMNTDVMEDLEVPDVPETRRAVRELLQQLREQDQQQQQASMGPSGAAGGASPPTEGATPPAGPGVVGGAAGADDGVAGAKGGGANGGAAVQDVLPGFGPSKKPK